MNKLVHIHSILTFLSPSLSFPLHFDSDCNSSSDYNITIYIYIIWHITPQMKGPFQGRHDRINVVVILVCIKLQSLPRQSNILYGANYVGNSEDEPEAINARLFSSTTRETPKPASTRRRKASLLPSKKVELKLLFDIDHLLKMN